MGGWVDIVRLSLRTKQPNGINFVPGSSDRRLREFQTNAVGGEATRVGVGDWNLKDVGDGTLAHGRDRLVDRVPRVARRVPEGGARNGTRHVGLEHVDGSGVDGLRELDLDELEIGASRAWRPRLCNVAVTWIDSRRPEELVRAPGVGALAKLARDIDDSRGPLPDALGSRIRYRSVGSRNLE